MLRRDERGWAVPSEASRAYVVYMAMVAGDPLRDAARVLGRSRHWCAVVRCKIQKPKTAAAETVKKAA